MTPNVRVARQALLAYDADELREIPGGRDADIASWHLYQTCPRQLSRSQNRNPTYSTASVMGALIVLAARELTYSPALGGYVILARFKGKNEYTQTRLLENGK